MVKIYSQKEKSKYLHGRINRKDISLDQNTQTINVYVSFINNKLSSDFLPGNYVEVEIAGKKLSNVTIIPRHIIDNESSVFVIEEGKLAREKIEVLTFQKDNAIVSKSIPSESKLITTILQKPLIGMKIDSINDPELVEEEVADSGSNENSTSGLN